MIPLPVDKDRLAFFFGPDDGDVSTINQAHHEWLLPKVVEEFTGDSHLIFHVPGPYDVPLNKKQ